MVEQTAFEEEEKSKTIVVMACRSYKLVGVLLQHEGVINGDGERLEIDQKKAGNGLEISWLKEGSGKLEKGRKDFWEREKQLS